MSLTFNSKPDYKLLFILLRKALQDVGASEDVLFDWERKVWEDVGIIVMVNSIVCKIINSC
jgi:hypothetical protein